MEERGSLNPLDITCQVTPMRSFETAVSAMLHTTRKPPTCSPSDRQCPPPLLQLNTPHVHNSYPLIVCLCVPPQATVHMPA